MTKSTGGQINVTVDGPIGWIVLDNPRKRNAMTATMWHAVPGAVQSCLQDPNVRVVVVRGEGQHFCAGADIAELTKIRRAGQQSASVPAEHALATCPLPTIAMIDGVCIGGGCEIALACDLRIASQESRLGITPAKLGIVYPYSSIRRLTATVGASTAKAMLFTAALYEAEQALEMHLVDEVVAVPEDRIRELVALLTTRSGLAVSAAKALVDLAVERPEDMPSVAREWNVAAEQSGELVEGIDAFLSKRSPNFPWSKDWVATDR